MAEKVQTILRVPVKLKALFKKLAQRDGRTMAGEFEWLVVQELRRRQTKSSERE